MTEVLNAFDVTEEKLREALYLILEQISEQHEDLLKEWFIQKYPKEGLEND